MWKSPTKLSAALLSVVLLGGCKTGGIVVIDHCVIDKPLTVDSTQDKLGDETARLIEIHNEIWTRICLK